MYWKVIFTNEFSYSVEMIDFIIANDYKTVADYAEKCIENRGYRMFYHIFELSERQRRKNKLWLDLRE